MVLIQELKCALVDNIVTEAIYEEGPDHFDEWYKLVREKYPNLKQIDCSNNKLTSLPEIDDIPYIDCSNNRLKFLD